MIVLGLNTAFAALEACVASDGKVLAEAHEPLERGHEQRLPGFIDALLLAAGVRMDQIERLAVVTGPGSFTGVRIGVSYMRGLALVTRAPCIGLTSLEVAIPHGLEGRALAALAAKRRPPELSWWVQDTDDGIGLSPVQELSEADLDARLAAYPGSVFLDAPETFEARLPALDLHAFLPNARTLAFKAALLDPDLHPPTPVYARAPDATLPPPRA